MKKRIYGSESEYALYFHRKSGQNASGLGSERLLECLKGLNALLVEALESKGYPRAGEFLGNGGRFYIDRGGHPEYATAECKTIRDLVAHEKAGDRLVQELAATALERMRRMRDAPVRLKIYKNNVDGFGNTYGAHENYLVTARAMENIRGIVPFLVTRQVYAGAGKVTGKLPGKGTPYQISQRADFFKRVFSDRTRETRGIVNTRRREIPRLGENRRLHIICGDCNLSEHAIALKFGAASLVLRILEDGEPKGFPELLFPVKAMKRVSRNFKIPLDLEGKAGRMNALEIQKVYLEKVLDYLESHEAGEEETEIANLWNETVADLEKLEFVPETGDLEHAPDRLARRVDWVTKLWLLDRRRKKSGLQWDDRGLTAMDYQYHDLDPATGIFERCLAMDLVDRWIDDEKIVRAMRDAPEGGRASIRGRVIREATGKNVEVHVENWEKISVRARNPARGPVHPFVRNKRIMNALELSMEDPFMEDGEEFMEQLRRFIEIWG